MMKHLKDPENGELYAYEEDGSQDEYIKPGLVQITGDEAEAIRAASVLPVQKTQFTSLEFLDRFTDEEQLYIVGATMQNAQVKIWYDRLLAASFVDLEDPRTASGIDALVSAGLIDAGRKAALLQPEVVA